MTERIVPYDSGKKSSGFMRKDLGMLSGSEGENI